MDPYQTYSVAGCIEAINIAMQSAYPAMIVEGEVRQVKLSHGKWMYFSLVDDDGEASLRCFALAFRVHYPVEDGMRVRILVEPKLSEKYGFSLQVLQLQPAGEGALQQAFALLKQRLEAEGLFLPERKRALPEFPKRIGIVTSEESAAWQDFQKIAFSRWGARLYLAHVQVQGEPAVDQIVRAVQYFSDSQDVDVVVVIRGGGSLEDLAAFNAEPVVRAVAGSRTPTIVGVGHESDTSLAELAADVRAATPTHAAQLVMPEGAVVRSRLESWARELGHQTRGALQLERSLLRQQGSNLSHYTQQRFVSQRARQQSLTQLLQAMHPQSVLARGYAMVQKGGHVVSDASALKNSDPIVVQFAHGNVEAQVTKIQKVS